MTRRGWDFEPCPFCHKKTPHEVKPVTKLDNRLYYKCTGCGEITVHSRLVI